MGLDQAEQLCTLDIHMYSCLYSSLASVEVLFAICEWMTDTAMFIDLLPKVKNISYTFFVFNIGQFRILI
jgi:hypothetical protein